MKHHLKIVFSLLFLQISFLGKSQCYNNTAFQTGEKITYNIAYNWGFIWVDAGEVFFKVDTARYLNKPVYHFQSYGTSYEKYDGIFKVRDLYESWNDIATLNTLKASRKTSEGGYTTNETYWLNPYRNYAIVSWENSNQKRRKDTISIANCTFDLLAATYFARNIDYSSMKEGEKTPFVIVLENKVYRLFIRYVGKEKIENKWDKKKYNCIKLSALLIEGTIFKANEECTVWVTDDKNRIPVLIEAKILVGTVKAQLKSAVGLRN